MSFLFVDNTPFEWPVKICVPNAGEYTVVTITGLFEQVDDKTFLAPAEAPLTNGSAIDFEIDRLCTVFKGWKAGDVLDLNNEPLEPTDENLRKFLAQRPVRLAVTDAYQNAMTPQKGYRAKN